MAHGHVFISVFSREAPTRVHGRCCLRTRSGSGRTSPFLCCLRTRSGSGRTSPFLCCLRTRSGSGRTSPFLCREQHGDAMFGLLWGCEHDSP
ncbi:uncharacterized protein LOC127007691 isoform X14 [Eriocheir sinensis]|uniref:uncharacterized protein LOC127007691 isoform X13 n=1 Tax=Eriocheir sinensis TaxID=95602 RepID=UPI0021C95B06|nr:uncharacterized protein LOC127007691 isoform X13 [Eriocheir sinensis]XP_050734880.1 uncharacterized protein LOC127007691 isoform X14 [Eriocheir sinensis]